MKKLTATALFLIIIMMSGCGLPGDPVLDDIYSRNVYPGTASTYAVGSEDYPYSEAWVESLTADDIILNGRPFSFPSANQSQFLRDDATWQTIASGNGSDNATWGSITGTLSDQADLQTALDAKGSVHTNRATLDLITEAFTTPLKTSYDWLVTNITAAWKTTVDNFIASKGAANGLAPLDGASKVPTVNLGGAGADGTKYLRGDQTWATPAGGGAAYTELDGSVSTTAAGQGGGDGAWVDWDLSGTLPVGTIEVDILIIKLVATDDVGCRENGSGLARDIPALKLQCLVLPVEVAADRIIEIMSDDVSDADTFSVIGYWD